ncbi:DUF2975 domain-containing protein [Nocardia sp. NPDC051833]|uniref:DUF2975 domain-containing protein n=1 Tax=Nocardia sp. NPDC051833 TaxID=3155674 RepID=UPI0034124FAB
MPTSSAFRWSGADNVVLRAVLLAAIGITGLVAVYQLLWIAALVPVRGGGHPTTIVVDRPGDIAAPVVDARTTGAVDVAVDGNLTITFHQPDAVERLLLATPGLLLAIAVLIALTAVLRIVGSLAQGDPFVAPNVRRIYTVAGAVLGGALVVPTVAAFTRAELQSRALDGHDLVLLRFTLDAGSPTLAALLVGMALVALAEVFRRGTALRDDTAGLI